MSSNGTANWIPDGYTQSVYFREEPGIHGETRLIIRPLAVSSQGQVQRELDSAGVDFDRRQWVAAKWMAKNIVQWDVTKPNGQPVNHNEVSQLLQLRPTLFNRIWACLNNQDGGDIDPDASSYEMQKRAERERIAQQDGTSIDEALEKN